MNEKNVMQALSILSGDTMKRELFVEKCRQAGIDQPDPDGPRVDLSFVEGLILSGLVVPVTGGCVAVGVAGSAKLRALYNTQAVELKARFLRLMGERKHSRSEMDQIYADAAGRRSNEGVLSLIVECKTEGYLDWTPPPTTQNGPDEYWATGDGRRFANAMLDPL